MKPRTPSQSSSGYTLVEILITMGVLGFLFAGLMPFFLQSSISFFVTEQKLKVNNDIRKFTNEMANQAREANHFIIYPSFANTDRDGEPDRQRDNESGDLMILIYYDAPTGSPPLVTRPVSRIVGYYRASTDPLDPAGPGPVRKFDSDTDSWGISFPNTNDIETLLPDESLAGSFTQVVELSRGLANQTLFYNFSNRSIMVKGEILHGNAIKRVSNTYNFTVSPRG
ncbi:MAG: type II secretion system protein [Opitutaceae bacterium]